MRIMLSIKPQYAQSILEGSKKYEFRKRVHRDSRVTTVVIYATLPVGKVIGEFTIGGIYSESPESLWRKTKSHCGISKEFFATYFRGRLIGHAIEIKSTRRYKTPMRVKDFLPSGVPPQSYAYLRSK